MYPFKQYSIDIVEDGEYEAKVVSIETDQSKTGHPAVYWVLQVMGGRHDQALVLVRFNLSSNKAVQFHKGRLSVCGVDAANRIEFAQKKDLLVDKRIKIVATTNDSGYQGYFVKGLASANTPSTPVSDTQINPALNW